MPRLLHPLAFFASPMLPCDQTNSNDCSPPRLRVGPANSRARVGWGHQANMEAWLGPGYRAIRVVNSCCMEPPRVCESGHTIDVFCATPLHACCPAESPREGRRTAVPTTMSGGVSSPFMTTGGSVTAPYGSQRQTSPSIGPMSPNQSAARSRSLSPSVRPMSPSYGYEQNYPGSPTMGPQVASRPSPLPSAGHFS